MLRGLISGLFWGGIVSALGLATVSLMMGPPAPSGDAPNSVDVAVPAGSEFNQDRPEAPPVIPGSEGTSASADAPLVTDAESESAPLADTASADVPTSATQAPEVAQAPSTGGSNWTYNPPSDDSETVSEPAQVVAAPGSEGEDVPNTPAAPEALVLSVPTQEVVNEAPEVEPVAVETVEVEPASTEPTQPAATEDTASSPLIIVGDAGNHDEAPAESEETEGVEFSVPLLTIDDADDHAAEETQQEPTATSGNGLVLTLPTVGGETEDQVDAEEVLEITIPEGANELGALARNSVPFTAPDSKPLMSIVLIDVGSEGVDRDALTTFSFPITIAINPTTGSATSAASAYRAAGLEVIAQAPSLSNGAGPDDVGDFVKGLVDFVPQAIGLVDASVGGFQSNRRLVDKAIAALSEGGHGMLTYDRGLNTAQQMAESSGLPAGVIFRTLDAEREDADTIKRYLDRAAFRAGQDGHVIMIGHSYPETVTAIFTWKLEGHGDTVNFAPLSAILRK